MTSQKRKAAKRAFFKAIIWSIFILFLGSILVIHLGFTNLLLDSENGIENVSFFLFEAGGIVLLVIPYVGGVIIDLAFAKKNEKMKDEIFQFLTYGTGFFLLFIFIIYYGILALIQHKVIAGSGIVYSQSAIQIITICCLIFSFFYCVATKSLYFYFQDTE